MLAAKTAEQSFAESAWKKSNKIKHIPGGIL